MAGALISTQVVQENFDTVVEIFFRGDVKGSFPVVVETIHELGVKNGVILRQFQEPQASMNCCQMKNGVIFCISVVSPSPRNGEFLEEVLPVLLNVGDNKAFFSSQERKKASHDMKIRMLALT